MSSDNPFDRSRNLEDPAQLVEELKELADATSQEAKAFRETGRGHGHPDPAFHYGRLAKAMEKAVFLIELALATKPAEPEKPATPPVPPDPKKKPAPVG